MILKNKDINQIKIGIAVSTYTTPRTNAKRLEIIDQTLDSLQKLQDTTKLNLYIVLVIDGKIPQKHQDIINKYKLQTYQRKENGGVARTKNTSIRLLLEKKIDIGFLADDDILIKDGCVEKYCQSMIDGNIHHMGYCQMDEIVHPKGEWKKLGYEKVKYSGLNLMKHKGNAVGCWLSFTPKLIKKIGYFKVMEGKYGYEHINFTHRCIERKIIPFALDIIDANNYINHIGFQPIKYGKYEKCHSLDNESRESENNKNKRIWQKNLLEYVKIQE